ncbi:hypothetical protein M409DRAFT_31084 [Zasmidium cellare ATCC 36951]|uniref:Indoleamine 2,3-dioxygenase n=1 Tax=Zasmidium cellare ATCC 36951 TaxID=1080233 RepID=A0A6A6BWI2_ZASCE|nr:uncharacterized protein M409DRAFT_31084 [Zasmidium cellare ATCC 36951]KAF2158398.1 hypothetical protein M409DRAFT_31084 [Zasmidium cellare ATCC 36951]
MAIVATLILLPLQLLCFAVILIVYGIFLYLGAKDEYAKIVEAISGAALALCLLSIVLNLILPGLRFRRFLVASLHGVTMVLMVAVAATTRQGISCPVTVTTPLGSGLASDQAPGPPDNGLENLGKDERQRAFKIMGFVAHAYVWGNGEVEVLRQLPSQLAIPLHRLGEEFGMTPLATYATTVLWNCSLNDPDGGWVPENVDVDLTFTGTHDEKRFYAVSACIEATGAKVLNYLVWAASLVRARINVDDTHQVMIKSSLARAGESMRKLVYLLTRVFTMDSEHFYWRMRPYFAGWALVEADTDRPGGVHYSGVDRPGETTSHAGISAAQSTLFQCIDKLLGIEHEARQDLLLRGARMHMPRNHRCVLQLVEIAHGSILKWYVDQHPDLAGDFDNIREELVRFRAVHLRAASKYAVTEASRQGKQAFGLAKSAHKGGTAVGAGGSQLEPLLTSLVHSTRCQKREGPRPRMRSTTWHS